MKFQVKNNSKYKKLLQNEKTQERARMHSFHRYYGKLIPAIPSCFIKEFTKANDLVFDPFTGSGTTAVEAMRHGRNFVGYEVNPLSQKIAEIKTRNLNVDTLLRFNKEIISIIKNTPITVLPNEIPYVFNRNHWFKEEVQLDLVKIRKAVDIFFDEDSIKCLENSDQYKDFYLTTVSAILKNVSNADTRHVFPGISKRMRKLEAEGKINNDVFSSFERGIKKRALFYNIYNGSNSSRIILGDSANANMSELEEQVDLIVTNPPYISSVRYVETLKLEMYWMEEIRSVSEYSELAHKMLGNDRLKKSEYQDLEYTNYDIINAVIDDMSMKDKKSAKIIGEFFNLMEKVIVNMHVVLKKKGKVVIKISDSKIKKTKIETGKLMTLIAENHGFALVDLFLDEINNNSRSLTTSRNSYSDIITHDYIIIWEKK